MINTHSVRLVTALAVTLLLAACGSVNSPEGAATQYVRAFNSGNAKAVLAITDFGDVPKALKPMLEKIVTKTVESAHAARRKRHIRLESVDTVKVEKRDKAHAVVDLALHYSNGKSKRQSVKVAKRDGHWRVNPL